MELLACALAVLAPLQGPVRPGAKPRAAQPKVAASSSAAVRPAPRPPAPPGLSWDDADAVERTLARLETRNRSARPVSEETVVVTERQLNSYVNLSLGPRMPPGVSGLAIRLEKDRLAARAMVDLERVKQRLPQGAAIGLLAFLSGVVPVELTGRVATADGSGRMELEGASIAGVSLPVSMISQIVSLSTRSAKQPQGIDLQAPFPLPFMARQVRIEPGQARVEIARKP